MQAWREFWRGQIGQWIIERGLRVAMVLIAAVLVARFVSWVTGRIIRRIDERFAESDELVRSEATKYHRSVTSLIQWSSYCLLGIWVLVQISEILRFSVGGLIAPAAVLGAALGFGAQQLVKDLLSGVFIIAEKQYSFGDLVTLTIAGSMTDASGIVERLTLRVTRLRSPNGEMLTVPNGQIVKSVNQSRDWARAVVDIPVSVTADLNQVNEVLHQVCDNAREDPLLKDLLLDAPTVMGVEKIEVDTVTLRLVARTLPGKQFEATRQLRLLVVRALAHIGIVTADDAAAAPQ
jgi:small conductance mechanosensitive channel